jgi:hypothetical protein
MASPATTLRAPAFRSWRSDRWPSASWARWSLRFALAVPFVVLAEILGPSGINQSLASSSKALQFGPNGLGWVTHAYPPITVGIARILPGGATSLANAAAICTGVLIQLTIERLILRSMSVPAAALLTAGVVITPVFLSQAIGNFDALLTLTFLSLALTGLFDFVFNRSTESGFIAGISFGLAVMCDLAALPFAVAGAIATFLLAPRRRAVREIARRRAAATVILFPSLAVVVGWVFLEWRFVGSATRSFQFANPGLLRFAGGAWSSLVHATTTVCSDLVFAPVLIAATAFVLRRRPTSALACASLVGCLIVDVWLGLSLSQATIVVLLGLMGLVALPEGLTRSEWVMLWICFTLQVVVVWIGPHLGLAGSEDLTRGLFNT